MSIQTILAQRGARYGNFTDQAEHCLTIKGTIFSLMGIEKAKALKSDQIEAISMIAHKLARITNGDPHYHDSWQDIAGYAQLVADRLIADEKARAEAQAEQAKDDAPCDCTACQIEAISNIANKLARTTNGDGDGNGDPHPHYHDQAKAEAEAQAKAEQAKDDAPCDCTACQLRTVLGVQHVVLVVETDDEDSEGDEQELAAAYKKAADALHKLTPPIWASRFTAN